MINLRIISDYKTKALHLKNYFGIWLKAW